MIRPLAPSPFVAWRVGAALCIIAGCSSSFTSPPKTLRKTPMGHLRGQLHGGQLPISGAHIYVYAAGTSGYLGSATSLLRAGFDTFQDPEGHYYVTTNSEGMFDVTGEYTCTEGMQVYLVGAGGDSGYGNNTAIVQLAALGQCPATGTLAGLVPFVSMNEISTVVMAYAVGGFGTTAYNISSSGTPLALTDIANAFANIPNIMSVANGFPYASAAGNPNSSVPAAKIISLANILGSCVNTGSGTSTPCAKLFDSAVSGPAIRGGKPATDEASAIFQYRASSSPERDRIIRADTNGPRVQRRPYSGAGRLYPAYRLQQRGWEGGQHCVRCRGNAWISDLTRRAVIKSRSSRSRSHVHQWRNLWCDSKCGRGPACRRYHLGSGYHLQRALCAQRQRCGY